MLASTDLLKGCIQHDKPYSMMSVYRVIHPPLLSMLPPAYTLQAIYYYKDTIAKIFAPFCYGISLYLSKALWGLRGQTKIVVSRIQWSL